MTAKQAELSNLDSLIDDLIEFRQKLEGPAPALEVVTGTTAREEVRAASAEVRKIARTGDWSRYWSTMRLLVEAEARLARVGLALAIMPKDRATTVQILKSLETRR